MSSSNPRLWLLAFAATLALLCGAALAITVAVDPSGAAAQYWPGKPQLCRPGLRGHRNPAKLGIAARLRPDEVFVGNSRVQFGFAEDVREMLDGSAANLAVSGADMGNVDLLVRRAMADAAPRRVWIGVDFALFYSTAAPDPAVAALGGQLARGRNSAMLLHGVANGSALSASARALLSPERCAHPELSSSGFAAADPSRAGMAAAGPRQMEGARAKQQRNLIRTAAQRELADRLYVERLRIAQRLFEDVRSRRISLVLFIAPVDGGIEDIIRQTGLAEKHARWRADMDRLAASAGAQLVEVRAEEVASPAVLGACRRDGRPPHCPFFDATHYRPFVGRMIVEKALQAKR